MGLTKAEREEREKAKQHAKRQAQHLERSRSSGFKKISFTVPEEEAESVRKYIKRRRQKWRSL